MIMPRKPRRKCRCCGEECSRPEKLYCNSRCQHQHEYETSVVSWKAGSKPGHMGAAYQTKPFVRRYLFEKYGSKCCQCGWAEIHPLTGKVPLEVNHIDGDAANTSEENLELLCPNCHSLTPNFRALNTGSVRKRA
jgi:hypothetical protein